MSSVPRQLLADAVDAALREDLGRLEVAADITTRWTVGDAPARARILARRAGVVCGMEAARLVFERLDATLVIDPRVGDGDTVGVDEPLLLLEGAAAPILAGERTALNFLQQLSGVATLTRAYADAVRGTSARITDTRKTVPGLRALQKHAVRCGGGVSHRLGLHDAVLIKENHARAAGGVAEAVRRARAGARAEGRAATVVMCEAESLDEVEQLVAGGMAGAPDRILLDNMSLEDTASCVGRVRQQAPGVLLEATGNVSLQSVRAVAETGVDLISVGALTHSAPALDLSLLFER